MRRRFHGLKRLRLRQSWNKYNLYNISRAESPRFTERTYFQQKWTSKALTRAYHGETIREKQWRRMFRSKIHAVIPLDHRQLARQDGHEQALGRGSGLDLPSNQQLKPFAKMPYMNMVYAQTERRLDTAIFRALFASSTRQARQFVVHGYVKVNGKKMVYPGYQLNPGDMYQVEPERVLFATGAGKDRKERRAGRKLRQKSMKAEDEEAEETLNPPKASKNTGAVIERTPKELPDPKVTLKTLLDSAKGALSDTVDLPAKRKRELRAFRQTVQRTLSRPTALSESLEAQWLELSQRLNISPTPPPPDVKPVPGRPSPKPEFPEDSTQLTKANWKLLQDALAEARENPIDASKPYATPWRPRPFMSAFAFVPRYLEVHHKICSAVYLRHPVARPGLGEVPTPYNNEINGLAFNWYLRRR